MNIKKCNIYIGYYSDILRLNGSYFVSFNYTYFQIRYIVKLKKYLTIEKNLPEPCNTSRSLNQYWSVVTITRRIRMLYEG